MLGIKYMQKLFSWFLMSSKNPANVSLTVKGIVSFLVVLGITDSVNADASTEAIVHIISIIGEVITLLIALWGFARKLANTFLKKE